MRKNTLFGVVEYTKIKLGVGRSVKGLKMFSSVFYCGVADVLKVFSSVLYCGVTDVLKMFSSVFYCSVTDMLKMFRVFTVV